MTMQDIVRERRTVERIRNLDRMDIVEIIHSDEDRIHALEVERDALREALEPVLREHQDLKKANAYAYRKIPDDKFVKVWLLKAELEAAAQAVEGRDDES